MMSNQTIKLLVVLAIVLSLLPAAGRSAEREEKGEEAALTDLVWPPPPLQPRVQYVGQIRSEKDVKVKKKRSWIDRIAGRPPAAERIRLIRPYGVAVGIDGCIYVVDSFQKAIFIFDREHHTAKVWRGSAQIPLFLPVALAFDAQSRLFVSDSRAAQVVVFHPKGKPVLAFGSETLKRPAGLAIDERRARLYVADTKLNEILSFDLNTLELLKRIGGPSTQGDPEPGRFSAPTNLALDREGRLYVTDTFNNRIQVFGPEGKFLRMFGRQGDRPGYFARPKGIALDSEGHIYVLDAGFSNFQIFDPEGAPLLFVGNMGGAPGQFLLPTGIAIDSHNRIYVTEHRMKAGRLQIFQYLGEKQKLLIGQGNSK